MSKAQIIRRVSTSLLPLIVCVSGVVGVSGCGTAVKQEVAAPAAVNNAPPGGGSVDEYAAQMQKMKGGKPGMPGGPGSMPGGPGGMPGSGRPPGGMPGGPR